jgi:hypothetical protein
MALAGREIPDALLRALEDSELSQKQLRELIAFEARNLGLTFDQAVERARNDTLPRTPQGFDLQFHVLMLPA